MVDLLVTYLEMTSPPAGIAPEAPCPFLELRREVLNVADYLALYREIGGPVQWDARLRLHSCELTALLRSDTFAAFVLRERGVAIGLCEFEGIGRSEVELSHFGLVPSAQGRGLGSYLLDRCLRECWSRGPRRVWLHTDTNDHVNAIAVYERVGFRCYKSAIESFPD